VAPDDLPFVTGSVGWLGTSASHYMMTNCDTFLMVGSSNPYTEGLPQEGKARGVQIDLDGGRLSLRYPMEVNLQGDSAETLRALIPLLERKADRSWRQDLERQVADWWRTLDEQAMRDAPPINPQRVFHELSPRLPDGCLIAGDCGSSTVWLARYLKMRRGMKIALTGTLATMGSAVPYAIAGKFAYPDRPAVAILGDGAMQMLGNNALITVAQYWRQWSDPRLVILALNNRDLNYVTWEQRVMEGEPKFPASQDLLDVPFARYAELLGLRGIRVETPEAVGPALDEALAADRPVVLEALTNADVPPLPPRLMPRQAEKLQEALSKGDPEARGAREQLMAEGLLPR